jgi:curved DNA-binding protein CbpA
VNGGRSGSTEQVPGFDLYAELEVAASASRETIEAAYRSLMKRHHPDNPSHSGSDRAARLNVAHGWLADRHRRAAYDATRGSAGAVSARSAQGVSRGPRDPVSTLSIVAVGGIVLAALALVAPPDILRNIVVLIGVALAAITGVALAVSAIGRARRYDSRRPRRDWARRGRQRASTKVGTRP